MESNDRIRFEALYQAVIARTLEDTPEAIVARATAFAEFLKGD